MTQTLAIAQLVDWFGRYTDAIAKHKDELTALDSAIGDADHGANLFRGTTAANAELAAKPPATVGEFGKTIGMKLVSTVGGASGPLLGSLFLKFGASDPEATELDRTGLAAALRAGIDAVAARGKAERGDKTMLDAFLPAVESLESSNADLAQALDAAAQAASAGRDATEPLIAKKGRASYLGERSVGHIDPGAASTALLWRALADTAS